MMPRQNGHNFKDIIFKCISLIQNHNPLIKYETLLPSLKWAFIYMRVPDPISQGGYKQIPYLMLLCISEWMFKYHLSKNPLVDKK